MVNKKIMIYDEVDLDYKKLVPIRVDILKSDNVIDTFQKSRVVKNQFTVNYSLLSRAWQSPSYYAIFLNPSVE